MLKIKYEKKIGNKNRRWGESESAKLHRGFLGSLIKLREMNLRSLNSQSSRKTQIHRLPFYRTPAFYIGRGCSFLRPRTPFTILSRLLKNDGRTAGCDWRGRRIAAAREINITKICRINANNSRRVFRVRRVCCCSRRDRKRTPHEASPLIPHGYYFLFYCFLYALRISVALLLQAHTRTRARTWNNASADMHNVVVKAFYIEPRKKRNDRYLQIRGKRR